MVTQGCLSHRADEGLGGLGHGCQGAEEGARGLCHAFLRHIRPPAYHGGGEVRRGAADFAEPLLESHGRIVQGSQGAHLFKQRKGTRGGSAADNCHGRRSSGREQRVAAHRYELHSGLCRHGGLSFSPKEGHRRISVAPSTPCAHSDRLAPYQACSDCRPQTGPNCGKTHSATFQSVSGQAVKQSYQSTFRGVATPDALHAASPEPFE